MTSRFLSELLILIMLLVSCSRFIFIKKVQSDFIAIVPTIALILSILDLFAWGVSVMDLGIAALCFFVWIWNFRALLRFLSNLVIDHFGFWSILISTINLIIVVISVGFLLHMRPAYISLRKFKVQQTSAVYTGSFQEGFNARTTPFQRRSAEFRLYEHKPEFNAGDKTQEALNGTTEALENQEQSVKSASKDIILFLPPKTATPDTYRPMLIKLAKDGYKVYTGQFFSKDLQWFDDFKEFYAFRQHGFINLKTKDNEAYLKKTEEWAPCYEKELLALYDFADVEEGQRVFIAGDEDSRFALENLYAKYPEKFFGYYDLATTIGYTTPGYGPVEQTEPLVALKLGYKRDGSLYMASHIAQALEYSIRDWKKAAEDALAEPENDMIFVEYESVLE